MNAYTEERVAIRLYTKNIPLFLKFVSLFGWKFAVILAVPKEKEEKP